MTVADLPALNATLNATSAFFLALGYYFIRTGRITNHKRAMVTAFTVSTAFLVSYVVYHWHHGSTPFPGTGWIRPVYFAILVSHVVLAIVVTPMAVITIVRALRNDFIRHQRIARITFPLWMYVSVTGVAVYWLLHQVYSP